ncbi:MAG: hypothetical protein ACK4MV_03180 [Beijerinckiaceae bacterium]
MARASSWSREADYNVRDAALDAARRAGLSLQDWLDETWRLHAAEMQTAVDSLDDDERAYAVARRLARGRAAAQGSRRSDRQASEPAFAQRAIPREPDDRIWSRVTDALDDIEDERRRETPPARADREARPEPAPAARATRHRFSIDDAIEDIVERQNELERLQRNARRALAREDSRAAQQDPYPLRRDLAKVAEALADLQRGASETVQSSDIDALRHDVSQIARGLEALAPRDAVEHIERAVTDLARRLSEARTAGLVDEFIAPVEELIGDLKRTLLGVAPTAALEGIERRIGALSRNVEALAQTHIDPDSVASLLEHSQDIREMLKAAAANRPNIELLERRISELGARIDRIADRGQTSAGFDAITQDIARIRADLEQQNPVRAFKALDARMDALARKMDQAATRSDVDAHFDKLGKRLDAMHRDLAERAPEGRRLEEMFLSLQARIDQARPAAGPIEMRDLVGQLMGRLDQAIGAGAEPSALAALEEQISRVAARLETAGEARAESRAGELARIESLLEAISARLDNPAPIPAADQVQETVRLLIERFETTLRSGVNNDALAAIERRLAEVAARLDAPVMAELDTARLESMIEDLAARMHEPGVAPADVIEIKRALAQIADRMDAALQGEAGQSAMGGVEQQIAALTQRVGHANEAGVARLERSLDEIQQQMERLRGELESPARQVIEREIADLRSLHSASDRRTHATLNAVHETLEKVVDRLAMLEDEIESAPKADAAATRSPAPGKTEPEEYKPSVELNFGSMEAAEAPADKPAVAPEPSVAAAETPRAAAPIIAERPGAARPQVSAAPPLNLPITDDFLLEPGSGKPSPRDVASALQHHQSATATSAGAAAAEAATQSPPSETDAGAQANFIAAVRRAQQAAGAARDQGSTGNQLLEEARARARAAAAEAEAQQAKTSGGSFGLKALFSGRKRSTTAAGLTGLAVVLGALQAANMLYEPEKARTLQSAQNVSPAPQAARQPEKATVRADGPQLGAIALPADRFTQAADMTPVASVPLNASAARETATRAPAGPLDPFALAAAGDAQAQYELGVRFAEGRLVQRDAAKAIDWLTKSAGQNFAPAQYRLGVIYEKGLGAARNPERARALYMAAAEAGNVKAMHNLGALLADGGAEGKPDYAAAARWFRKAADHGVRDSQYNLAILSARGLGVQQNLVESYVWFSAAAAQGDADAGAKLKEVAPRLDAAQLARAQATVKALRPHAVDPAANEPREPEGGWASTPEPAPNKPSASRTPKISSLQTR